MRHQVQGHHANLPPFWIGLSLLVWGVFTDQVILGAVLALIAEAGSVLTIKWELSDQHFYRVADATSVFFAVVAVYQFNEHSIYAIYRILALLPVCIFPLLLAQRYSTQGAIPLSALFLSLRRRVKSGAEREQFVTTELPFFIVCVLAASASDISEMIYLATAFSLSVGALFGFRTRRHGLHKWVFASLAAATVAFSIQAGVKFAQSELESSFSYWFNQYAWFRTDPVRALTSIGSIGRLKLSDQIRVRVYAPLSIPLPITLREASYSRFNLGTWSAPASKLVVIDPNPETLEWHLAEAKSSSDTRSARIVTQHRQEISVLPLPVGATRLSGAEVVEVQQNQYGTTLVEALPGQFEYNVSWSGDGSSAAPPDPADLNVPENYLATMREIAAEIGLAPNDPKLAMAQLSKFFQANFKYSLIQKGYYPGRTALSHFLLKNRKGHCEFFATATTLLLRHAGVPARYTVGYIVDEYSPLEKTFIARARHAHSWVEAYVDNRWVKLDTTPSDWYALEDHRASRWQRIQDLWSWLANRYQRFQRSDDSPIVDSLVWLVPPLGLWLFWRMRTRMKNVVADPHTLREARNPSEDLELYRVAQLLSERGYELRPGDTLRSFLRRNLSNVVPGVSLERLLELHYRNRFQGAGLTTSEREELRTGSEQYYLRCRETELA